MGKRVPLRTAHGNVQRRAGPVTAHMTHEIIETALQVEEQNQA